MLKYRSDSTRPQRVRPMRLLAVVAAVALCTVGAGVLDAGPSSAAPGDPITTAQMPDQGLRDAVNAALGQTSGSSFTEGQAATIGFLNGRDRGITELDGIEYLTGLGNLRLFDNPLDDTDAQYLANHAADLSNVTILNIGSTDVGDVGATAIANNLTGLTDLNLGHTDVGDAGATAIADNLANLTGLDLGNTDVGDVGATAIGNNLASLTRLYLNSASVNDVSPLSALINLDSLALDDHQIIAAPAVVGDDTLNPVVDENGDPVAVNSSDPGFAYDSGSNTWAFSSPGSKTLEWSTKVTIGSATAEFSGTVTQQVGAAPTAVSPEAPVVTEASCDADGNVIDPSVVPASTDGITYRLEGTVAPGATIGVRAFPNAGHMLDLSDAEGWSPTTQGVSTFEVTLDPVDCSSPVTTVPGGSSNGGPPTAQPTSGQSGSNATPSATSGGQLPATGPSVPLVPFVGIGLGLFILGAGLSFIRRRTLHNS